MVSRTKCSLARSTSFRLMALCCFLTTLIPPTPLCSEELALGEDHSILLSGNLLVSWGNNAYGQLGRPVNSAGDHPPGMIHHESLGWVDVASGSHHNIALDENLQVWSWGLNNRGQLGLGDTTQRNTPVAANIPEPVLGIATGLQTSYAVTVHGNVFAAGDGSKGQLANGLSIQTNFAPISIPAQVTAITAGPGFALALDSTGQVWGWGENGFGQLTGAVNAHLAPFALVLPEKVAKVKAGGFHALALAYSGNLYAWGRNYQNLISSSPSFVIGTPLLIDGGVDDIDAGREHMAYLKGGELVVRGRNQVGQLGLENIRTSGNGTLGLTQITAFGSGPYHNLAIGHDNGLLGWGKNRNGQVDGTGTSQQPTPVSIGVQSEGVFSRVGDQPLVASANALISFQFSSANTQVSSIFLFAPSSNANQDIGSANTFSVLADIATPGTYLLETTISTGSNTFVRITPIYVQPARYGEMIWGEHVWSSPPQPSLDLR